MSRLKALGMVAPSLLYALSSQAATPAQISLNKCQNTVKVEAKKFIAHYVADVGTCLQKVSTEIVQNGAAGPSNVAASACVAQYRKIHDTRGLGKSLADKLQAKITFACAPGIHTLQDILGSGAGVPQPLDAENLGTYCSHFGGDGSIDTLQEWVQCVAAVQTCAARSALSAQYPRLLNWTALLQSAMGALTPPVSDPTKISDAMSGVTNDDTAIEGANNDDKPEIQCGGFAPSGTAAAGDVLTGKTFSNSSSIGLSGAMPNNGAVSITPGTSAQAISQGYHNGLGSVTGDADLISGNVRSGANIFGVIGAPDVVNTSSGDATAADVVSGKKAWVDGTELTGTAIRADGNATAGDVLSGKTFSNASGVSTGAMPNNGAVNITPGAAAQSISAGYHTGAGTVNGDADLIASNIVNAVNIFGVTGTAIPAAPLKTGQTTCYDTNGASINCAGTGQDGEVQKGVARQYVDNGDGTISDVRTGLMWEKLCDQDPPGATCPTDHDVDTQYNWTNAFAKITSINTAVYAGYSDWRLPNLNELQSLPDIGRTNPAIDPLFTTACVAPCSATTCSCTRNSSACHWSSSTYLRDVSSAWIVYFIDGNGDWASKSDSCSARAVRGGS